MALSAQQIYSLAQVSLTLKQLRSDYESSRKYCEENNKANGIVFNTNRIAVIDEAIAAIDKAITSK